ncbi:MAG TPA: undecaprenyl-diphosphatase UppP [Gemmataceae bacterium]|jgi:undecaprenyl-diphosphatase|nr:undecaprenyl-diphosphatase UppP [Gemmataceae bacterium]
MSLWEAVVLGVIQGLTEFLPISSTAHLLIARQLMGHANPRDYFTTAIQLGTLVAVFVYFRADIVRLLKALVSDIRALRPGTTADARLGWKIVVGTLPVVVCGFAFKPFIKGPLYDTSSIAAAAIVFGLLLLTSEMWSRRRTSAGQPGRGEDEVTWRDAILIGCFQALALIPGASRSGVTITAGLLAGLSRPAAARFSFLLSLPSILGAGLFELYENRKELASNSDQAANLLVGAAVAGIVGYLSIAWLLGYLKKHATYGFVIYRLVLGATLFGLLWARVIH